MSFISFSFLFYFLPVFFLIYWVIPKKLKAIFLLAAGIVFYACGDWESILVLLGVILVNWLLGFVAQKKVFFCLGILLNLSVLASFKYFDLGMGFPLGISFYIFHAISYLCDVHSGKSECSKNPLWFALYISLFTKITMGPIVSYSDLEPQLKNLKNPASDRAADGILMFSVGFAKKAVLAGSLANLVASAWPDAANSTLSAWLGIVGYTLQLYFDFSGYSDMAVGLSRMLGLEIADNFRYPYLSTSVSEFWRRWHISLGAWFKEYLYIPLGGNRKGALRIYLNLLIVWLATGIWHGDGLNFIVWGLWHFAFVFIEKLTGSLVNSVDCLRDRVKMPKLIGWAYTFMAVMLGWVLFNSANLHDGLQYISYMFGNAANADQSVANMLLNDNKIILGLSVVGATMLPKSIAEKLFGDFPRLFTTVLKILLIAALFYISITQILANGYSPFIYTEF